MLTGFILGLWAGISIGIVMMTLTSMKLVAEGREQVLLKMGAFVCSICPLCIYSRSKPDSEVAKLTSRIEKRCPFCLSFKRLRMIEKEKERIEEESQTS